MARNERYVTTIELNSQQAQDRLKQLTDRVAELRKQKAALKPGEWFNENELKKATRELANWKAQLGGVQGVLDNINDVSLETLNKTLRKLKGQKAKFLPDSEEYKEAERGIMAIENRIEELKNGARQAREESEQLTNNLANLRNVMSNIKGASLSQLTGAQKYLEERLSTASPESSTYATANAQLKEVKARIQEIKAEQQVIVHQIDRYDQEIKQANKDISITKRETDLVNNTLANLHTASVRDLEYSIKIINEQMRDPKRGEAYFKALQEKAKLLRTELEKTRFESQAQQSLLNRTADFFNKIQGAVITAVGAITGLTFTIRRCTNAFAEMDQEMENVRKYTGQTTEQVHAMNEEFKQMDTRTARERLNQLAGDAGRLGITSQEAVMDFVDAADKINVALGDDLGDSAVKNIGKLAMSFGEDEKMGLRGAMLATGSAVNELSQNSSAAANYLVDFTARVAGFGRQVGLTQTQIMGFAAVMDENLLQDEMAATAFGQLLVKMTTDIDTFARITGMKVEAYKKLVTEDINGAVLAVARSLRGRDMEDMGKVFDAMNLNGQRAIGVLSTLGQKVGDVVERQRIANEAYEEGTSIIDEFNIQNSTAQAQLEKAKKHFSDLSIELGEKLMPIVRYGITSTSALVRILSGLINIISTYKATIIVLTATLGALILKKEMDVMITKAEVFWNNTLVTSVKRLWAALLANPFTAVAAGAALLLGYIIDLSRREKEIVTIEDKLNQLREQSKVKITEEKDKVELLIKASKNEKLSLDERLKAIDKLQRIIPGYCQELDKETGKYKENKKALDDYLKSLVRKYEVEGAKEMLQSIGKEVAQLTIQVNEAKDKVKETKEFQEGFRSMNPAETNFVTANTERAQSKLDEANNALAKKLEERKKILKAYGEDLLKEEVKTDDTGETPSPTPFKDPKKEAKETKAAEAAAKRAAAAAAKALRESNNAIKAQIEQEIALTTNQYAKGEIDYRTYVAKIDAIQMEGFNKRMAIYSTESDEYKKLLNDREQYAMRSQEKMERIRLQDVEKEHNEVVARIESSYYDPNNDERYLNDIAVNEAIYQADIIFLQEKAKLYKKGSEERAMVEEEIEERERSHKLENERNYNSMLQQVRDQFLMMGNEHQLTVAMNGLDELHKQGLLKEEEYQRAKIAIQAQYGEKPTTTEQTQKTGSDMLKVASNNAKQEVGDAAYTPFVGTIQTYTATMEQLKQLYANDERNHAAYLAAKQQATAQFCAQLSSEFQAAYNGINQMMTAASNLYGAQSDLEVAQTKKKYEAQIAAAGNNQRKIKKLQEKQAKEEAAIKTKYNRKQVKIQIAQAIAQTAQNALAAYGSAAAIPVVGYILAPIAAAMAVAAGMMQVAAIKKQAEAQEAGYYEGGYTGGKRYRKEAGVVHEGEFVANHQAVNNPNIRPMLDFIDQAQRNNTIGSLSRYDLQRNLGNGQPVVVQPNINVSPDNSTLEPVLGGVQEGIDRLNAHLDKGLKVDFVLDEFDKENRHYQKMKNR